MRRVGRAGGSLGLVLLLAGCFSPTTHFYTLAPVPPTQPVPRVTGKPIQVRRVILPAALDRLSLVESKGPERLAISDQDRWASPLDGMVQGVLASDLNARLPGLILAPGDPAPAGGARGLSVNIREFMGNTAGTVTLLVDWALLSARTGAPVLRRTETIRVQAASDEARDVTVAMSRALGRLSDRIAAVLGR